MGQHSSSGCRFSAPAGRTCLLQHFGSITSSSKRRYFVNKGHKLARNESSYCPNLIPGHSSLRSPHDGECSARRVVGLRLTASDLHAKQSLFRPPKHRNRGTRFDGKHSASFINQLGISQCLFISGAGMAVSIGGLGPLERAVVGNRPIGRGMPHTRARG